MNELDRNRKYKIKINSPEKERIKEISKIFSERLTISLMNRNII